MTLLLVDDHVLFRRALSHTLSQYFTRDIILEASNGQEAIQLLDKLPVDLILLDIQMPVMNGLETIKHIRCDNALVRIMILTMHAEPSLLFYALQLGANGLLQKETEPEVLTDAIKSILNSGEYYNEIRLRIEEYFRKRPDRVPNLNLSKREMQVMELIQNGLSNKEISTKLELEIFTIESYRKSLMAKTKCRSVADLISLSQCFNSSRQHIM